MTIKPYFEDDSIDWSAALIKSLLDAAGVKVKGLKMREARFCLDLHLRSKSSCLRLTSKARNQSFFDSASTKMSFVDLKRTNIMSRNVSILDVAD